MNLYISIPISGHNKTEQRKLAQSTKESILVLYPDWVVVTPFEIADILDLEGKSTDGQYLGIDITHIIDTSDAVFFCKGWDDNSKGCAIEHAVAQVYGKITFFEEHIKQHPVAPYHGKTLQDMLNRRYAYLTRTTLK